MPTRAQMQDAPAGASLPGALRNRVFPEKPGFWAGAGGAVGWVKGRTQRRVVQGYTRPVTHQLVGYHGEEVCSAR